MKKLSLPLLSAALLLASCGGGGAPAADTSAPSVSLSAAQNGTTVSLTATASDNVGVTKVEFYRGGTLVSTDATAPYTASFTVNSADNGVVNVTARAYDAAGNQGQGGAQVTVNVPRTPTLYQGVWGWGIIDPVTEQLIDNGAVVYSEEATNEGRTAAFGGYLNESRTRQGFSVLGPISASGSLETGFTASTDPSNPAIYFIGQDDDNRLGTFEGNATFEGGGALFNSSNQPSKNVYVILIQTSTIVPSGTDAIERAKAESRALVERLGSKMDLGAGRRKLSSPSISKNLNEFVRER